MKRHCVLNINKKIMTSLLLFGSITVNAQLELAIAESEDVSTRAPIVSSLGQPRLSPDDRLDQSDIANQNHSFHQIRKAGLLVFSTPFNEADGYGDGPHEPLNPENRLPGNRPRLQGNGTFLRVNGLDSQTCLECHTITSNASVPARLGVGGVGGISQTAIVQPDEIDVTDVNNDGAAHFTGRIINPPFLFGSGGVELVGLEMTAELQELKQYAIDNPNTTVALSTKGVDFGSIIADASGNVDTSEVEGVTDDLVVKPFGRKGEFATVREFDVGAMSFHLGMEATELVGDGIDHDFDGVIDEIKEGDLSALSIFNTTMNRPFQTKLRHDEREGRDLFNSIGCSGCHIPEQNTNTKYLPYKLIGANESPFENSFYQVNLTRSPMRFRRNNQGGVKVNLFSDLKHHFMGEDLKETFTLATDKQNGEFITARLWGIADTAPYLHDGRALTLEKAIVMHDNPGSEAASAGQNFKNLSETDKLNLIKFLNTLRTPNNPNSDVVPK